MLRGAALAICLASHGLAVVGAATFLGCADGNGGAGGATNGSGVKNVRVFVRGPLGEPIEGARTLCRVGPEFDSAISIGTWSTDSAGVVEFGVPVDVKADAAPTERVQRSPGRLYLEILARGFMPALPMPISIHDLAETRSGGVVHVRMAEGGGVLGRTVDALGKPIANAEVRLVRETGELLASVRSASDGRFTLPSKDTNPRRIEVYSSGLGCRAVSIPSADPGAHVELGDVAIRPGSDHEVRLAQPQRVGPRRDLSGIVVQARVMGPSTEPSTFVSVADPSGILCFPRMVERSTDYEGVDDVGRRVKLEFSRESDGSSVLRWPDGWDTVLLVGQGGGGGLVEIAVSGDPALAVLPARIFLAEGEALRVRFAGCEDGPAEWMSPESGGVGPTQIVRAGSSGRDCVGRLRVEINWPTDYVETLTAVMVARRGPGPVQFFKRLGVMRASEIDCPEGAYEVAVWGGSDPTHGDFALAEPIHVTVQAGGGVSTARLDAQIGGYLAVPHNVMERIREGASVEVHSGGEAGMVWSMEDAKFLRMQIRGGGRESVEAYVALRLLLPGRYELRSMSIGPSSKEERCIDWVVVMPGRVTVWAK